MRTSLSLLSATLLMSLSQGANAFSVRMVPVARTLAPRFVSSMITPESRLDRVLRDPFSLLDAISKDDFYGLQPLLKRALQATDLAGPVMEGLGSFKVDVMETDKVYKIQADLPGCKKDDVKVTFTDGVLEISAERRHESRRGTEPARAEAPTTQAEAGEKGQGEQGAKAAAEAPAKYYVSEIVYGSLVRSFRLPSDADSEHISAQFENGVLKVELPKRQSPSKKTVEIA